MNKFEKAIKYQMLIEGNEKLKALEIDGFVNGEERGKTMVDMTPERMFFIVQKQLRDLGFSSTNEQKLKAIADLRNVAGLMFLLIDNPKALEELK
jgi:hypothetical protein